MQNKKHTRGGKRAGSGRKRKPYCKNVTGRVTPEDYLLLKETANSKNIHVSALVRYYCRKGLAASGLVELRPNERPGD